MSCSLYGTLTTRMSCDIEFQSHNKTLVMFPVFTLEQKVIVLRPHFHLFCQECGATEIWPANKAVTGKELGFCLRFR